MLSVEKMLGCIQKSGFSGSDLLAARRLGADSSSKLQVQGVPVFLQPRSLLLLLLMVLLLLNIAVLWAMPGLHDLGSFIAAARAYVADRNPYATDEPLVYRVTFTETNEVIAAPNLNPPFSLYLFWPLAYIDPAYAVVLWRIGGILLYAGVLGLFAVAWAQSFSLLRLLWALNLAGLWHLLICGQIYILLLGICSIAWLLLQQRRMVWAGLAMGLLIAIKPHFVIWPILLLIGGYTPVAISAGVTAGALTLLPVVTTGLQLYQQWLTAVQQLDPTPFPNMSLTGWAGHIGAPWLGMLLSIGALLLVILRVRHRACTVPQIGALALTASLLASPITWIGYTILLLPIFLTRTWSKPLRIAAVMLVMPHWVVVLTFFRSWPLWITAGWFYGWVLVVLFVGLLCEMTYESRSYII